MTDDDLHALFAHPDWEYETTKGTRKAWADEDVPPYGDGWERNTAAGDRGWERFDYHEEAYWRRRRPAEVADPDHCREWPTGPEGETLSLDIHNGTVDVCHGTGAVAVFGTQRGFQFAVVFTPDEAATLGARLTEQAQYARENHIP